MVFQPFLQPGKCPKGNATETCRGRPATDTPANVRDFYLEKGPGPGPEAAAVAANGGEPFPAPRAVPVGGRTNGH